MLVGESFGLYVSKYIRTSAPFQPHWNNSTDFKFFNIISMLIVEQRLDACWPGTPGCLSDQASLLMCGLKCELKSAHFGKSEDKTEINKTFLVKRNW